MYAQWRLKSACASMQSDQSSLYARRNFISVSIHIMCPVKILIRLRECAGWSESLLGTHIQRYIFGCCGSHVLTTLQPLYNTARYNMVMDITRIKDGSQKCIDYIEKWPYIFGLDITLLFSLHGLCYGPQQQCYKEVVVYFTDSYVYLINVGQSASQDNESWL